MTPTFSQHELEIIKGHETILGSTEKEKIENDLQRMIDLLTSEEGKSYLKNELERHYTLKQYQSTIEKINALTDLEFKNLDFSLLEYFDD